MSTLFAPVYADDYDDDTDLAEPYDIEHNDPDDYQSFSE